jgi:hypothetical protein
VLTGTPGPDTIDARAGNDIVHGLGGNDQLFGGAGNDQLFGDEGNDTITGGGDADLIDGGAGTDTAVYPGVRADYLLSRDSKGVVTVADKFGVMDTLLNVETLLIGSETINTAGLRYQPETILPPDGGSNMVFRFFNVRDSAYFYTNTVAERDMVIRQSTDPSFTPSEPVWPYFYQGATFEQAHSSGGAQPVYRFYNFVTGHHFFTVSEAEKEMVLRESSDPTFTPENGLWPFNYEGVGFSAFGSAGHPDASPVFRFYSPSLNRHFFTASADEAQEIRLTGVWNDEGIGFYGEVPG